MIKKLGECQLTGCAHLALLKASHIKPWKDSDNIERLDVNNGLLLTPLYDELFDKGFISFYKEDVMQVSDEIEPLMKILIGMSISKNITISREQEKYMNHHRNKVYKGNNKKSITN